jgi:hypothetical protein
MAATRRPTPSQLSPEISKKSIHYLFSEVYRVLIPSPSLGAAKAVEKIM